MTSILNTFSFLRVCLDPSDQNIGVGDDRVSSSPWKVSFYVSPEKLMIRYSYSDSLCRTQWFLCQYFMRADLLSPVFLSDVGKHNHD